MQGNPVSKEGVHMFSHQHTDDLVHDFTSALASLKLERKCRVSQLIISHGSLNVDNLLLHGDVYYHAADNHQYCIIVQH